MCGIAGFASRDGKISQDAFYKTLQLTLLNEKRGNESTGIALMEGDNRVRIYKDAVSATKFIPRVVNKYTPTASMMLTHTRLATMGAVIAKNAHPFQYNHITGVHNGWVNNHRELGKFDVDSQAIFKTLSLSNGDYKKALPKLSGLFAIAWMDDREPNALYLVRDGNPLFVAFTSEGMFFSSQEESLEFVLIGVRKQLFDLAEEKVFKITDGYNIDSVDINFKPYSYANYGYSDYTDYYGGIFEGGEVKGLGESYRIYQKEKEEEQHEDDELDYEDMININLEEFHLKQPDEWSYCESCGNPPLFRERWFTDGIYEMCQDCLFRLAQDEAKDPIGLEEAQKLVEDQIKEDEVARDFIKDIEALDKEEESV